MVRRGPCHHGKYDAWGAQPLNLSAGTRTYNLIHYCKAVACRAATTWPSVRTQTAETRQYQMSSHRETQGITLPFPKHGSKTWGDPARIPGGQQGHGGVRGLVEGQHSSVTTSSKMKWDNIYNVWKHVFLISFINHRPLNLNL